MESLLEFFTLLGRPATAADLDQALRDRPTADVVRWLLDQIPSGEFLLDKTPSYSSYPEALARSRQYSPYCIWLIRHPLGVIHSHLGNRLRRLSPARQVLRRVKDRLQRMVRGGLSGRARRREKLWRTQNENIRAFLSTLPDDHKHVVLFEDLVADSAGTLQQVCSAMGLDFEPGMQAYQPRDVMAGIGDAGFGAHKGITPETADAWRQYYSEAVLQPETRTLMSQIWRRRGAG